ncbi:hypothetical protein, partial [Sinorhizobium medicae]|uniref:hypothetical protein n=1 Tax=Sinorhizobium medicae TaxID=110321 RepID=UPI0027DB0671
MNVTERSHLRKPETQSSHSERPLTALAIQTIVEASKRPRPLYKASWPGQRNSRQRGGKPAMEPAPRLGFMNRMMKAGITMTSTRTETDT